MARKRKKNYLNNKDLFNETVKSLEQDEMSDELVKMLMMLVRRIASRGNFATYTYNEDMEAYALMMLVRTWRSFKPEKSTNAFAFFTQCIKNSFKQVLNQERKQRDIRDGILVNSGMTPSYTYMTAYEEELKAKREGRDLQEEKRQQAKRFQF